MLKENNCCCVVCQVERSLLNSLSTQTARGSELAFSPKRSATYFASSNRKGLKPTSW